MIDLYIEGNKNYDYNGDMVLEPSSLILTLNLKGICQIEGEHPFDKEGRWKYIKFGSVIACPTPYSKKQLFRVYHAPPSLTGIKIYARHIAFDLDDDTLIDVRPTNATCEEAMNKIFEGTKFKGHSNIEGVYTSHYIRKTRLAALCSDDENSIISKYGGERLYDNFDIYVNKTIGSDNGVRAEFGYNMRNFEGGPNLDTVVTSIIPVGYNGIMLEGSSPWIDSKLINSYDHIIRKVVHMDDIKVKENQEDEDGFATIEEARQAMRERCLKLFDDGLDKPETNYIVEMEDISKTTQYKGLEELLDVSIGDYVTCKHYDLDIDLKVRCISMTYDCITEEVIELELGDATENYFEKQSDIANKIDNILNSNGTVKGNEIQGFIDATKAIIKAQSDIAKKLDVRAIQCEDLDPASPSFGSWIGGTKGIQISEQRTLDGKGWDYTTALTAKGVVANTLYGKILAGEGVYFDLEKGEVYFKKGLIEGSNSSFNLDTGEIKSLLPDGSEIIISPKDGFYNKFGLSKREYHHLSYQEKIFLPQIESGSGYTRVIVKLPDEFEGKDCKAFVSLGDMLKATVPSTLHAVSDIGAFCGYFKETNEVYVDGILLLYDIVNKSFHNQNQNLGVTLTVMA